MHRDVIDIRNGAETLTLSRFATLAGSRRGLREDVERALRETRGDPGAMTELREYLGLHALLPVGYVLTDDEVLTIADAAIASGALAARVTVDEKQYRPTGPPQPLPRPRPAPAPPPGPRPSPPPAPPAPPATPLTKSVLDSIAKCPAMKSDLEKLQKGGWRAVWGPRGGGYSTDRSANVTTLDPSIGTSDDLIITMLSHEMGHAKYTPPSLSPAGLTKAEYIKARTQSELEDEGEATLTQIGYKDCLKKGGGPNVQLWYGKSSDYVAIAKKYPDDKDRGKARTEIANLYGDGEKPSNCPAQTYRQYYENPCCAPACGTGAKGYTNSFTDDQWKAMGGKI